MNSGGTTLQLVKIMQRNKSLSTREQIGAFVDAMDELMRNDLEPELLPQIYVIFDDTAWHTAPLDALISYIARYSISDQVDALLSTTSLLREKAKYWLALLYRGLLVNMESRQYLKNVLANLSETEKKPVLEFLEYMRTEHQYSSEEIASRARNNIEFVLNED